MHTASATATPRFLSQVFEPPAQEAQSWSWFDDPESDSHDSSAQPDDWTDETIVRLHFMLLDDVRKLADPATPLAEKFEILRWIYTDPAHDAAPFSFVQCLKLFGRSINPGLGVLDASEVRAQLRNDAVRWIADSLKRYPAWVREVFLQNPDWIDERLTRNPQSLNEATRVQCISGDLFASDAPAA